MADVIALVLIAALFVFAAWLGDRLGRKSRWAPPTLTR